MYLVEQCVAGDAFQQARDLFIRRPFGITHKEFHHGQGKDSLYLVATQTFHKIRDVVKGPEDIFRPFTESPGCGFITLPCLLHQQGPGYGVKSCPMVACCLFTFVQIVITLLCFSRRLRVSALRVVPRVLRAACLRSERSAAVIREGDYKVTGLALQDGVCVGKRLGNRYFCLKFSEKDLFLFCFARHLETYVTL